MMNQSITRYEKIPNKVTRHSYAIFHVNFPGMFPSPNPIHQKLVKFDMSVDKDSLNVPAGKEC